MTDELKQVILKHIKKYPKQELQDVLKMLYQNEFGPKHLTENEIECFKSLSKEFQSVQYDENEELFEDRNYSLFKKYILEHNINIPLNLKLLMDN